ncbi:DUF6243 family protein [Streptomyces sp. MJP52]|uniref:DUF6243 family protein n=1 Tax=Streptomyces sp. MJP52 TaxID=2940555 RepID=UPI002476C5CD|nr:DUF6243 family protein [Streptomyces sp. MJP52]MDH6225485.1 hypothetical protein [Streptomyces sp. MJP52]
MANRRNDMLGVGGQRKKLSRSDRKDSVTAGSDSRRTAAEQKQELLRRMRERTQGAVAPADGASADGASADDAQTDGGVAQG